MPEAAWVKKTLALFLLFGIPALILLVKAWRETSRAGVRKKSAALWVGFVVLVLHLGSIANIFGEWSVGYMVAYPLLAMLLTVFGVGVAFTARTSRVELISGNALLFVLAISSLVAPN